jgi:hypothetical protein
MSTIKYNSGIPPLPPGVEIKLKDSLDRANIASVTVSSTYRSPSAQAAAMYRNLEAQGVKTQYDLYGPAGDKVIAVYELKKKYGYGMTDILKAMTDKIIELGPSNVSTHCVLDPEKHVAFDILPASVPASGKALFESEMRKIGKFLVPGKTTGELVYHVEINKSILTGATIVIILLLGAGYMIARRYGII